MRPDLETYEQIDAFLNGELKGNALTSFQERMQNDAAFTEEVELQKMANELIVGASFQDLREQMSADLSKIDASTQSGTWKYISIALGFIAFSSAVLYFSPLKEHTSEAEVFPQHREKTSVQKVEGTRAAEKIKLDSIRSGTTDSKVQTQEKQLQQTDAALIHQSDVINHVRDTIITPVKQIPAKQLKDTAASALPVKKETTKPVANPCAGITLEAHISTSASCADRNTGSIHVAQADIKGGTAPYTLRLDKSRAAVNNAFTNLAANTYTVSITDQAGCSKSYTVEVAEKFCNPKSAVFAPDKGEVWKYEGLNTLSYTLTLLNAAGQQVFRTAQMDGDFEWQGYSQKGDYLDAGLYIYVAEYTDGTKENGQVTIAR